MERKFNHHPVKPGATEFSEGERPSPGQVESHAPLNSSNTDAIPGARVGPERAGAERALESGLCSALQALNRRSEIGNGRSVLSCAASACMNSPVSEFMETGPGTTTTFLKMRIPP